MARTAKLAPAGERLAVMEAMFTAHAAADAVALGELKAGVAGLHEKLDGIEKRLSKQTGFVAGVASLASLLWAVVAVALAYWPFGK